MAELRRIEKVWAGYQNQESTIDYGSLIVEGISSFNQSISKGISSQDGIYLKSVRNSGVAEYYQENAYGVLPVYLSWGPNELYKNETDANLAAKNQFITLVEYTKNKPTSKTAISSTNTVIKPNVPVLKNKEQQKSNPLQKTFTAKGTFSGSTEQSALEYMESALISYLESEIEKGGYTKMDPSWTTPQDSSIKKSEVSYKIISKNFHKNSILSDNWVVVAEASWTGTVFVYQKPPSKPVEKI